MWAELGALLGPIMTPLRALVVAGGGLWLSAAWLRGDVQTGVAVLLVLVAVASGYAAFAVGRMQLPHAPALAVRIMEWWSIAPLSLAVMTTALTVRVALHFALPSTAPDDAKEIAQQSAAAITTFLSSVFIAWAADEKESPVADRVRAAFQAAYTRRVGTTPAPRGVHYFAPDSRGEQLVFSDPVEGIEGWARSARLARAQGVAEEIANGTSEPS